MAAQIPVMIFDDSLVKDFEQLLTGAWLIHVQTVLFLLLQEFKTLEDELSGALGFPLESYLLIELIGLLKEV